MLFITGKNNSMKKLVRGKEVKERKGRKAKGSKEVK